MGKSNGLDLARTNVERGYVGDGDEGRELKKKNIPAIFDFFPPLVSLFPHTRKNSFNLTDKE